MPRRREPREGWNEQHRGHVPQEFEQAGRRGWYRAGGRHDVEEERYGHDPRWPGPPGEDALGPQRPTREADAQSGDIGRQGYPRDPDRRERHADDFDGTDALANTSGYDDYEAESLYGARFGDGDWPQTWREASGDAPLPRRDHRGLGPEGYRRSDQRILEDVHERLTDDPYVDARGLRVRVEDAVVHIEGEVDQRWIKHHVEQVAARCAGVADVDNRVRVRRGAD